MAENLALVTGASSGIGLALAKELAVRGYDIIACSAGERLGGAVEEIAQAGVEVVEVQADLSTSEGVDTLWAEVERVGRSLDVACINAGIGVGGKFIETDLDEELKMVALNCVGTVHLTKHVVRAMAGSGGGKILITSSIAGEMVAPREAVYAATKAFDLSFAQSIRYELKDAGITVTALQPGPTDTDFFHRAGMDDTKVGREGKHQSQPEDVARDGIDALFAGKDHVYAHALSLKLEGAVANFVPGSVKAAMHEKQATPESEQKAS